ncbi:MAG: methylenetetrahydrofolate reductase [Candidatus Altiarchaeota archaeon]
MSFRSKILSGGFAVTGEIAPAKGVDERKIMDVASLLKDCVDAINVTDNQRACVRTSSLAVSKMLLDSGVDPVFQMTCRDRNRIGIQSDLLGAHMLGIRNVLALTGDHPSSGDHPSAMPVYDIDSTQLIQAIRGLNKGVDMEGNKLDGKTDFLVGAAFNPGAEDRDVELLRISRKMEAGAMFFQTQVVYDAEDFIGFMKEVPSNAKVLAGIVPLKSKRMADFMNEKIPGVSVPQRLIDELEGADNPVEEGISQAADIIREIRPYCSGVHMMALGSEKHVKTILDKAGV